MKILLTGATGYIGQRLLPVLIREGHDVICLVRDPGRFNILDEFPKENVLAGDLLKRESLRLPEDIECCYYLVHSMSASSKSFDDMEYQAALNFVDAIRKTRCRQLIYLSGIVNSPSLSKHLSSRLQVEKTLQSSGIAVTSLRAGIIIGSGSASFEIIRDLTEKLPVMVAPRWLNTRCQPIAIRNVIYYLKECAGNQACVNQIFDIGGTDILTYKQMLLGYAKVRKLRRVILTLPVLTPRLSAQWLRFVTTTTMPLAESLIDSMRNEVVVQHKGIEEIIPQRLLSYEDAIRLAFEKIKQNEVVSSWTDAYVSGIAEPNIQDQLQVPEYGCVADCRERFFRKNPDEVLERFWTIGGQKGWYKMDFLWRVRGMIDKLAGGVGLRRGRRSPTELRPGDALDFWRVLVADKPGQRLLLYAEMKLPGEAWLEFRITAEDDGHKLVQKATFRPCGLLGRLYWWAMLPFHHFIFSGMLNCIVDEH